MVIAPPSCLDATKLAPPSTRALLTAKLPLPIRPNTWRTPRSASAWPTASATFTEAPSPEETLTPAPLPEGEGACAPPGSWLLSPRSALDEGEHAGRAAGAADDRQRRGDQDRAGRWELGQVGELGQPVLAGAEQEGVTRERRVEAVGGASVGADRLDADPDDRRLLGQPAGAGDRDAGGVRPGLVRVQESGLVVGAGVPAGSEQQPAAGRQRAVLALPGVEVLDLQQEVRV